MFQIVHKFLLHYILIKRCIINLLLFFSLFQGLSQNVRKWSEHIKFKTTQIEASHMFAIEITFGLDEMCTSNQLHCTSLYRERERERERDRELLAQFVDGCVYTVCPGRAKHTPESYN